MTSKTSGFKFEGFRRNCALGSIIFKYGISSGIENCHFVSWVRVRAKEGCSCRIAMSSDAGSIEGWEAFT